MAGKRYGFQPGWWRRYLPFAGGFLVVATFLVGSYFNRHVPVIQARKVLDKELLAAGGGNRNLPAGLESVPGRAPAALEKNLSPVEKFVRSESLKMGHADPDPAKSHARLKAVAQSLGRKDLEALKRSAMNTSLNGDRRFLSVYLLALSDDASLATPALLSIALTPMSIQDSTSMHYAEELMIRTQALEGMARQSPGSLKKFLSHQDNSFLADQARRLLQEKKRRSARD